MATKTPPNERAAKRRKLAKKGHALPDGSFPIPNAAYLEKAKHRIGSAHPSKRAAAKALINRRAKELGRPGLGGQDPKSTPRKKKKKPVKTSEDFSGAILLVSSSVYPGLDRSPKANWVDKAGGLPNYIERIAKHLHYEKGMDISRAIATAVNVVKKMCATGELNWPGHQTANAGSQAEACAAVASWERKKAGIRATATNVRGRKLTDLELAEIIGLAYVFINRAPGASGSNKPFDESKYLRGVGGKFASKLNPEEMIAGHRIVEAGIINLQVGQTYKLPTGAGWVQRSSGGYLVQGPAGIRVAFRTASEAVQAAANIMVGQLRRVGVGAPIK
jgi:hypothetical protein